MTIRPNNAPVLFPECQIEYGAHISDCGKYRYGLWRIWNRNLPFLCFVLLNPSTADGQEDDPTVSRCMERARQLGYGGIYIVNLFAYRSANPDELFNVLDPVGPENDQWLKYYVLKCHGVVCGWGKDGKYMARDVRVLNQLHSAFGK